MEERRLLAAQMVADIGTATASAINRQVSTDPNTAIWTRTAGSWTYFSADDGIHGKRLYRTDGTAANTALVAPLDVGAHDTIPLPVATIGNVFLFDALRDGGGGYILYRTDGTDAGTQALYNISSAHGTVVGSRVFVTGSDASGTDFIVTDGTVAGTHSFLSGTQLSTLYQVVGGFGSSCYFSRQDGSMWQTDGTTAGSKLFANGLYPQYVFTLGSTGYILTDNTLYSFSGTASSVTSVSPGSYSIPSSLTVIGSKAYYFEVPNGTAQAWVTDGTAAGTHPITGPVADNYHAIDNFVSMGGNVYFRCGTNGGQLWRVTSTGTSASLILDAHVTDFVAAGSKLFFGATDAAGSELWTSDGTTAGSQRVIDLVPGPSSSAPSTFSVLGTKALYYAIGGSVGTELHVSDGTAAGTHVCLDINTQVVGATFGTSSTAVLNNTLYFTADDIVHRVGSELWKTDGTVAGTKLVADVYPGELDSGIKFLTTFQGAVYFAAMTTPAPGNYAHYSVWRTNGTAAGTVQVYDLGGNSTDVGGIIATATKLFFAVSDQLLVSDGTTAGTTSITPTGFGGSSLTMSVAGNLVLIATDSGVWTSDGTLAGTKKIVSNTQTNQNIILQPCFVSGRVVFATNSQTTLWSVGIDGSNLTELAPGLDLNFPFVMAATGNNVYFQDRSGITWTDGTVAGTHTRTFAYQSVGKMVAIGPTMYFVASGTNGDPVTTNQIWKSDGTLAGTVPVTNFPSASGAIAVGNLYNAGGVLVFSKGAGPGGYDDIWQTDGTLTGTFQVSNINPGGVSNPQPLGMIGRQLLFAATEPVHQTEFWGATIVPTLLAGTSGADSITLTQSSDHQSINWTLGAASGQVPVSSVLDIVGGGGSDTITLVNSNGNPLPAHLNLSGAFTLRGLTGSNPLANTTLDIGASTLFITYANAATDPLSALRGYLSNGYNGGLWNGTPTAATGVISSVATAGNLSHDIGIGYADSADGLVALPANTIELKYTLYGDTGLTGSVGFTDFMRMTQHYTIASGATWSKGDFNYDGAVGQADFNLLQPNFGLSSPAPAPLETIAVTAAPPTPIDLSPVTGPSGGSANVIPVTLYPTEKGTTKHVKTKHGHKK